MKRKAFVCLLLAGVLAPLLCGCSLFTADTVELLHPPALSGDVAPIAEAIAKSAGAGYTLKYPSAGNFRSAVIQNDIDSDGVLEAFAFYSTADGDEVTMHINVICKENGAWRSVAEQKLVAGGVDRVDFCDLDSDGVKEILVGWEIYGASELQLAVYSLKKDTLSLRMQQKYTQFICSDLDEDRGNEIFVVNLNSAEQTNLASVFVLTDTGVSELFSCLLDPTAKTIAEPVVSTLSSGKPAVYIDEIKGAGAVTEVVYIEKNSLVNPLFDSQAGETSATLRAASLTTRDINDDGILEIPVQESVPSVSRGEANERLYLTNWCSYNGETLTTQMTAMMNQNDGYYYILSQRYAGRIAIMRDTEKSLRELYLYDRETQTVGDLLLTLQVIPKADWTPEEAKKTGLTALLYHENQVYACRISERAAADGITVDAVKESFQLLS